MNSEQLRIMPEKFAKALVKRSGFVPLVATLLMTGCYGYLEGKNPGQVATPTPSAAHATPIPDAGGRSLSDKDLLAYMNALAEKNKLELENKLLKLLNTATPTPEAAAPTVLPPQTPTPAPTAEPTPEPEKSVFRVSSSEDGWRRYSGKGWKIINGILANDGTSGPIDDSFLSIPFNPGANFTFTVDIRQDADPYTGYGIALMDGDKKCYVGVDGSNAFFTPGHPNSAVKHPTSSDYTAPGTWRTHKLEVKGNEVIYYIDGMEKIRTRNNKCTGNPDNRVGFWSGSTQFTVDNLEITRN